MKYVRFQGLTPVLGTSNRQGIFQLAYRLKNSPETSHYDDTELRRSLTWLEMHLNAPKILNLPQHQRAICWFKESAAEPLNRIWNLKYLLETYGFWIDMIKTRKPGVIIYQDGWQVAAKPFRDGSKG